VAPNVCSQQQIDEYEPDQSHPFLPFQALPERRSTEVNKEPPRLIEPASPTGASALQNRQSCKSLLYRKPDDFGAEVEEHRSGLQPQGAQAPSTRLFGAHRGVKDDDAVAQPQLVLLDIDT